MSCELKVYFMAEDLSPRARGDQPRARSVNRGRIREPNLTPRRHLNKVHHVFQRALEASIVHAWSRARHFTQRWRLEVTLPRRYR